MMRIHSVDYSGSICDGPGIRTVIYVQGCRRNCSGCHNPTTWDETGGKDIPVDVLAEEILAHSPTKRITISGGEPLLQKEELAQFVFLLRKEDYDIALYTSYTRDDVPNSILESIDYLKTGEYIDSLRTTVTQYVGSSNQRFDKIVRSKV